MIMHVWHVIFEQLCLTYSWVFPIADDLLKVICWVKEEMLSPFIPIHRHGSICINTAGHRNSFEIKNQVGPENNVFNITLKYKLYPIKNRKYVFYVQYILLGDIWKGHFFIIFTFIRLKILSKRQIIANPFLFGSNI